jgi:phage gp46-like protein
VELAYCCRLFGEFTRNDTSGDELAQATGRAIDLHDPVHTKALLRLLNQWGCRQFAVEYHGEAGRMFGLWGDRWLTNLPSTKASLGKLDAKKLAVVADAYADLKDQQASARVLTDGRISKVTVGATGAAKALHILRPRVLPPWDDPMRAALGHDGTRDGYLAYLKAVQAHVRNLEAEAAAFGIAPADIPRVLGRPTSSLPKMIDEYYWVTLTRGHVVPDAPELARWYKWSRK